METQSQHNVQTMQHKSVQEAQNNLQHTFSTLRQAVVAQRWSARLRIKTLKVVGSIPAGCRTFFLFLSLSSVSLIGSHAEVQHFRFSLIKNGYLAVQLGVEEA